MFNRIEYITISTDKHRYYLRCLVIGLILGISVTASNAADLPNHYTRSFHFMVIFFIDIIHKEVCAGQLFQLPAWRPFFQVNEFKLSTFDLSDGRRAAKFSSFRSKQLHFIIQKQNLKILIVYIMTYIYLLIHYP